LTTATSLPTPRVQLPSESGPPEDLVVDLSGTDGHGVLPVRRLFLHLREEQLQGPLVDARVLRCPLKVERKAV
jgi:hypothetical protein